MSSKLTKCLNALMEFETNDDIQHKNGLNGLHPNKNSTNNNYN